MASEKSIKTRLLQKIDTEENWIKAVNFIPIKGELIIYCKDDNHSYDRIKVGDGINTATNLPFIYDFSIIQSYIDETFLGGAW